MEQEKLAREAEEKAKAERENNLKEGFSLGETNDQWEKDKQAVSDMVKQEREQSEADSAEKAQYTGKPAALVNEAIQNEDDLQKNQPGKQFQGVGA